MFSKIKLFTKSITFTIVFLSFFMGINAQNYVEIGTGTVSNTMPIYSYWNYSWSSMIYPQSALGTAKTVTKIALNCTNGPKTVTNQKIYIKHTTNAIYGSAGYEDPTNNAYTLVYDGNLSFVNGWNEIDITDFVYNGTNNISIHWENRWNNTYGPNFNSSASTTNNNKNCGNDQSFPTTGGTLNPYPGSLPNMRFYYASSGPSTPSNPIPADNAAKASASNALSFDLGSNTINYDLYFGIDSANVASLNASVKVVNNATVAAAGTYSYTLPLLLTSKTKYFWRVVAKSGAQTEVSPLWKFITEAIIANFPYNQTFEDSTVFYPGWYGSYTDWTYTTSGYDAIWHTSSSSYLGTNCAYAYPSISSTLSSLTSPRFNLPANHRISYWWKNTMVSGNDAFYFEVSTNGGTSWTVLDTLVASTAMNAYVQKFKDLSTYGSTNFNFQFRYQRGTATSVRDCYIDDIKVEAIPTGATMTLSSGTLNFNDLYVNGITKKKVIIGNIGTTNLVISGISSTAPFSCSYTGTILPGATDTATILFTATTAGNFSGNLTINNNGTGNNVISATGNVLPLLSNLFENFESTPVNTIPANWNKLRSKDPYQVVNDIVVKNSSFDAYSAPNVIKMYNNTDTVSPLILITPGLTNFATDSLKFFASKTYGNTAIVKLIVGLMDDPYNEASFVPVTTITLADSMVRYIIAFDPTNTKPYIGFRHAHYKPSQSIWIDDVSWQGNNATVPNSVAVIQPLNNAINVITLPTLKWTSTGGNPTGYRLNIGTNNPPSNVLSNVDLGNVTSYAITSALSYNTTYYWQVTPYNATGNATNCPVWSFTTYADPTIVNLPWTEGFESVTPTTNNADVPLGWTTQNGGMQSTYWDVILNNATYTDNAHTGQKAMNNMFSMLGSNNDWMFSPKIQLTAGTAYDFSFWYKAAIYIENGDTTFEKLAVYMGTAADSSAMGQVMFKNEFMRFPTYVQCIKTFTPAASGGYVFGFHSYSDPLQWITFVDDVKLSLATSVDENEKSTFTIYPNPSNGEFVIRLSENNSSDKLITVTNLLGQEVYRSVSNKQYYYINLKNVDKGIYLIRISSSNSDIIKKLIIN
jgi:hypothetical protein